VTCRGACNPISKRLFSTWAKGTEEAGKIIAEKLAIDWLRVNRWDNKEKTLARTKKYKNRYNMPVS